MDGALLTAPPEVDAKQSFQDGASAPQMAQVVPDNVSAEEDEGPGGCIEPVSGKIPFITFFPGMLLMTLGTALISTGAMLPLTINGACMLLISFCWHFMYRSCLDGGICPGRTGMGGFCARLGGNLLFMFCCAEWVYLAAYTPEHNTVKWTAWSTIVLWPVAFYLLRWEAEQCRQAVTTAWRCRQPIDISAASVAQLAAAARAKGEPYFPASVIELLGEKQVDGEVLKAVLKAEQTRGPDCDHARAFLDEIFLGVATQHVIVAKGILRDWVERGVPKSQLPEPALVVQAY